MARVFDVRAVRATPQAPQAGDTDGLLSPLSMVLVLVGAVNRWYPQALDIGSPLTRTRWTSRLYHRMLRSSA